MSVRFGEQVATGFHFAFEGTLVHSERSPFQKIDVYDHPYFGRVLTLDDVAFASSEHKVDRLGCAVAAVLLLDSEPLSTPERSGGAE